MPVPKPGGDTEYWGSFSNYVLSKNDILLQKLFWPTVKKKWDQEKLFKFEAEGREFAKFLRSLEQFIQTVKVRTVSGKRMLF